MYAVHCLCWPMGKQPMCSLQRAATPRRWTHSVAPHIHLKSCPLSPSAPAEDPSSLAEFTPSFMWLLRDFYYDLTDDKGVKVGPGRGGLLWARRGR